MQNRLFIFCLANRIRSILFFLLLLVIWTNLRCFQKRIRLTWHRWDNSWGSCENLAFELTGMNDIFVTNRWSSWVISSKNTGSTWIQISSRISSSSRHPARSSSSCHFCRSAHGSCASFPCNLQLCQGRRTVVSTTQVESRVDLMWRAGAGISEAEARTDQRKDTTTSRRQSFLRMDMNAFLLGACFL